MRAHLQAMAASAEGLYDRARRMLRRRLGRTRPSVIVPFRGFGTEAVLFLRGRLLEERGYHSRPSPESRLGLLRFMFQRFKSEEVPGVLVSGSYAGGSARVRTDDEGYFDLKIEPRLDLPVDRAWHDVAVVAEGRATTVEATAPVFVPPVETDFGIISDIDDTIIKTSATSLWKMIRTTLLTTPESRLPFPGVAAFYQALHRGPTGSTQNPVFYVSSSPWNLYDVLESFMDAHGIPFGPLFLRDFGLNREYFLAIGHRRHKRTQITRLLEVYEDLDFILIGDSGQRDPEIYAGIVRDFPGRILAVYIRDVGLAAGRARTSEYARMAGDHGVDMLLVEDTEAAALHAVARGYIGEHALADIRADKAKDKEAANDLAQMLGITNGSPPRK